ARAVTANVGPVVREVKGAGRFQIRKVTKADLRKAAEELSKQETQDPFALYAAAEPAAETKDSVAAGASPARRSSATSPSKVDIDPDFEDPLFLEPRVPRPKPQVPRPATR